LLGFHAKILIFNVILSVDRFTKITDSFNSQFPWYIKRHARYVNLWRVAAAVDDLRRRLFFFTDTLYLLILTGKQTFVL